MSLLVAQLTDTHLFADIQQTSKGMPTWDSLQAVLGKLKGLTQVPDLLLLTGDLSQDETPQSYERLKMALAPFKMPIYWLPGNHDRPHLMNQILCEAPLSRDNRVQVGNWTLLLLDSVVPGEVHGYLTPDTLTGLDSQLKTVNTPFVLIALHHPPLAVGSAWIDRIGLANGDEFQAIIHRYPQVKTVLFGHIHQELDQTRSGIRYLASPSTCIQFKPNCDEFALDGDRHPGFRLLKLCDNGQVETWVERTDYRPVTHSVIPPIAPPTP